MKKTNIEITAGAYLLAAMCVMTLPLSWLAGWLIAVAFHEAGHILVLGFASIPIYEIKIGPFGAKISTAQIPPALEFLCAAAGPLCSFLLVCLHKRFPIIALIGLMQGLFNLIPIYPLDGGRMFRSAFQGIREILPTRKIPCKEQDLRVQ